MISRKEGPAAKQWEEPNDMGPPCSGGMRISDDTVCRMFPKETLTLLHPEVMECEID